MEKRIPSEAQSPKTKCPVHLRYHDGCDAGCRTCEIRRVITMHECNEDCRNNGCVLVHKGYAHARWCSSCGSMGMTCFYDCSELRASYLEVAAMNAADRADDAAYSLPDLDTSGPNDPHSWRSI